MPLPTLASALRKGLRRFVPAPLAVSRGERLRACVGALAGLLLTGVASRLIVGEVGALPLLIAPMGASAVLLFALPASPLAQPWSLVGGNLVSALIGVACAQLVPAPMAAAALAVAAAIGAMFALRCVHPPSGAVALTAVLGGPAIHALGYGYAIAPVGLNSLLLLVATLVYNNLTRHPYPHAPQLEHRNRHATADAPPADRLGFTPEDLDAVLSRYDQLLDIGRDELETIFLQTEMHAYARRFGAIRCGDFMSRDVLTTTPETPLRVAWTLLRRHHVKALPVVDGQRRLLGIVTLADMLLDHEIDTLDGARNALHALIEGKTERRVDSAMTRQVRSAAPEQAIAELVPLLSDAGFHHLPIIDAERRVVGMLTQSDLLAALYRAKLEEVSLRAVD